jgi:hypothetical protein
MRRNVSHILLVAADRTRNVKSLAGWGGHPCIFGTELPNLLMCSVRHGLTRPAMPQEPPLAKDSLVQPSVARPTVLGRRLEWITLHRCATENTTDH